MRGSLKNLSAGLNSIFVLVAYPGLCAIFLLLTGTAQAELKILPHEFAKTYSDAEMEENHYANPHVGGDGVFYEQDLLQLGADYGAAGDEDVKIGDTFRFVLDKDTYLLTSLSFMAARDEGETCTPTSDAYLCKEGQLYTNDCFLTLAEDGPYPKTAGESDLYQIDIRESVPVYCSGVSSVGIYDKKKNLFLVTVRYSRIDKSNPQKGFYKKGELALSALLEAKKTPSGISLVQVDSCIGNPNHIETIPEARKALTQCETQKSGPAISEEPLGFWQRLWRAIKAFFAQFL